MESYHYALAVGVGLLTGFINTLAGSGTLLTLPFFIFLGLPADVANGTNRLGVFAQTLTSSFVLRRQLRHSLKGAWVLILPAVGGAGLGAYIASIVDKEVLEGVIAAVMLLLIYPTVRNTDKWMRTETEAGEYRNKPLLAMIFFVLGVYGGFIQAGTGIFILISIVLVAGRNLTHANVLKNLIVFLFTIPALTIFILQGQVMWEIGIVVMTAQSIGAWFAARFLSKSSKANVMVRYLLILMLVVGAVSMVLRLMR